MKHFLLKFNHGVEIGAYLAYKGHYDATGDLNIRSIAREEIQHKAILRKILKDLGEKPSPFINRIFKIIGGNIRFLCHYSPKWLLNFVASSMEIFAVFSYGLLADKYSEHEYVFRMMAIAEKEHETYFKEIA